MKLNKRKLTPTCKCCNLPFSDKIGLNICDCGFLSCKKCKHCDTHCKCDLLKKITTQKISNITLNLL